MRVRTRSPAGRPAGTHTAAASGAAGPCDAARCSPGAADGAGSREPRPGCSGPTDEFSGEQESGVSQHAPPPTSPPLPPPSVRKRPSTYRFGVIGSGCQRIGVSGTQRPLQDVQ